MTFFNTTKETGELLELSHEKAKTQEESIYVFFLLCNEPLSPSMVLNQLQLNCPITSVRRAMSNLTTQGRLEKTGQMVKGAYGKNENLWKIRKATEEVQGSLFAVATST